MRRGAAAPEPFTLFDRMDRLFGEWMRTMPVRTPLVEDVIRVDEYHGTFNRALPLPEGVSEDNITANYRDGILEIRIPLPEQSAPEEPKKISVQKG